jgi:hypothetical protein
MRPPGTQAVYLRGFVGREPTLLAVVELALEALGGRPRHPIPEEYRQEFGRPITALQLKERQRNWVKKWEPTLLVILLLHAVMIPICLVIFLLTLPWGLWKAYRVCRNYTGSSGGSRSRSIL